MSDLSQLSDSALLELLNKPQAAPTSGVAAMSDAELMSALKSAPQERSTGEVVHGLVDQAIQGIPIVGPALQKGGAAAAALMGMGEGGSFGERYSNNAKLLADRTKQFAEERPVSSAAANIAGGVAATLPLAATATGAKLLGLTAETLPGKVAAGALSGGAIGGGDALVRGTDPLSGVSIGGVIGGLAPVAGAGIGKAYQALRNATSTESNVARDLGRALARDDMTPEVFAARAQELAGVRPGVATLADAGGENVRGLVERVAQTPGAGRTTVVPSLTGRQVQQLSRVTADLSQLTGSGKSAFQAIDEAMASRQAAAKPLYDQAFDFNAREVPEIVNVWQRETAQGWGQAVLSNPAFRRTLQTEYGIKDPKNAPLMVAIDAWKKSADDMVENAMRNGHNNVARVIGQMRDRVVGTVDQFNPNYAAARDAWAGPSRYMDAVTNGKSILNPQVTGEELRRNMARLSASEREGFVIGAVSALRGKMGSDPAKMPDLTKYLRSPEMREKIAAIMPNSEAAETFMKRLDFEVSASELTGRSLGNSATARRLAERQDADGVMGDLVMAAFSGMSSPSFWRSVVRAVPDKVRDTVRSKADARLADTLINPAANSEEALSRILSPKLWQTDPLPITATIRGGGQSLSNR